MFNFSKKKQVANRSAIWTATTMLVFGVIGLIASFVLAIEEFHLLKDPNAVLSCSINLILNCSTVMQTWQASVFGFPNMFIGLMGFPIVITVAVGLLARATFARWFLITANTCYGLGALFAYWLFFNSLYAIQVLCPWCLIVTFATTMVFATITHYNLRHNTFGLEKDTNKSVQSFLNNGYEHLAIATWVVTLIALVFIKFGDSLFT